MNRSTDAPAAGPSGSVPVWAASESDEGENSAMATKPGRAKLKRRFMRASSTGPLQLTSQIRALPIDRLLPVEWTESGPFIVGQGELGASVVVNELPGVGVGLAGLIGGRIFPASVGHLCRPRTHVEQEAGAPHLRGPLRLVQYLHTAGREVRLTHEHVLEMAAG